MAYITTLKVTDKTTGEVVEIPVAIGYATLTSKGNLQIASEDGKNINFEAGDNLGFKPVGNLQLDTNHYALDDDKDEFAIKAICDKASKVQGLKIDAASLKFVTEKADTGRGWDPNTFKMQFKKTSGTTDTWAKLNLHAGAIDLRTRTTGAGTGGGIAAQISSCDSSYKENKFKIETDRCLPVEQGNATSDNYAQMYNNEGGKGMEIFTMNSQHLSAWAGDYRFKADAPIYAVTRGELATVDGKTDYPTQADDFKDIINDSEPITWADLIAAVKYLKAQGAI